MSDSFTYRGVSIDTPGPYYLQSVDGWFSTEGSADDIVVGGGHGSLLTPVRVRAKTVTLSGVCVDADTRDELFWALRRAAGAGLTENTVTSELVGDWAGVVLTADAQLVRWQATVEQARWSKGVFGFDVEFRCPDPRLYGGQVSQSSFLALPGTGLALPTTLPAAIPENPVGGLFAVENEGTADAPARYILTGPLELPGVLLNAGTSAQRMVQYGFNLADAASLVIDTRDGGAGFVSGAYVSPVAGSNLTSDLVVRPGVNTVQALGTASTGSPGSSISVTFRPAYW